MRIDRHEKSADFHTFVNAIFWGNAPGLDFAASCDGACANVKGTINVSYSMVQTQYLNNGQTVTFGEGIVTPVDPLFADPANGDFHLKSMTGRWTPAGYVRDSASSPALARGFPGGAVTDNPERAGRRNELGAYGNSAEASFTR